MAGPTEFSLESVRQYMLGRDGQVTNHELVKYFRAWLTHPTEKESARQRFKEYVNTLATIRQENGEKYLVLKRKYYPHFDDDDSNNHLQNPPNFNLPGSDGSGFLNKSSVNNSPSLLDEVMASYTPISKHQSKRQLPTTPPTHQAGYAPSHREFTSGASYYDSPSASQRSSYASSMAHMQTVPPHSQHRTSGPPAPNASHMYRSEQVPQFASTGQQPPNLPPYRPPPPQHYRGHPPPPPAKDLGLPVASDYGLPAPRQGVFHPPTNAYPQPTSNMLINPFEAVNLPSLTAYGSAGPAVNSAIPPLPTRQRESIDSGNSQMSRSSSSMSIQGGPGYQQSGNVHQQSYQHHQQQPYMRSQYQQGTPASYQQQQTFSRDGIGMMGNPNMQYSNPPQNVLQHSQYNQQQFSPPPPLPTRNGGQAGASLSKSSYSRHSSQSSIATRSSHGEPVSRKGSSEAEVSKTFIQKSHNNQVEAAMAGTLRDTDSDSGRSESVKQASNYAIANQNSSITDNDSHQSTQIMQQQQKQNELISVKERTQTFNRMVSHVELDAASGMAPGIPNSGLSANSSVKRRNSRAAGSMHGIPGERQSRGSSTVRGDDNETSSISTLDQTAKQWMVKAAQGDYHSMAKMLQDDPRLAKHKDFVSGYTALHWAAKHGNLDMVKLLAGSYSVHVNQKSHGGYTPLHLACQFGHQEVFDILVKAYGADPHLRDNSGRKPRQYMVVQDQAMGLSLSSDTFRQLKDRRRHRRQAGKASSNSGGGGALSRFGSLSVKVKKTTEAFNNYFNSAKSGDVFSDTGGFAPSSLPPIIDSGADETGTGSMGIIELGRKSSELRRKTSGISNDSDSSKMPPPKFSTSAPSAIKKRKSKRSVDYGSGSALGTARSAPVTPTSDRSPIKEGSMGTTNTSRSRKQSYASRIDGGGSEESDSDYGFDTQWSTSRS